MPIKSFSDIDLHGAQLKTSRLDNIPNQSYLNFDGQIGLDTSTDKLEYMNSLGVQIVASEDWVLNNSSQGVNLIQGSGTTFVDYGTAGQVDLGGALTHDTVINGLYNLTFNNKITQINSNSLVGGVNIGSNPNASAALFVDGTNQLGYNSALLVTGSSVVNGGVIPSQGYASYLAYDSTIYTHAAGRIGQWYRVENPTASGFVVNLGDNVTNHNAAMATIGWFPNANGGGLPMTGSSNSPLLSVVKNPYNKNGFDHTGALIDLLNYPDVASNVASGDFVKAHNGAYDQFNVKSDGSVFAAAGTNGLANATTFAFTGYDLQIKKLNYLYIDTPSINIGSNAGQTTGLHGIMPISIGFNANSATQPIGDNAITIGNIAYSTGVNSVAIGSAAAALADRNVSIGSQAGSTVGTTNLQAISIGYQTNFGSVDIGLYSTAVGTFANASSTSSVAIGASSQALSTNSISIGLSTSTTNINAIAIGNSSIATGADSLAIGAGATASASSVIAIGESATASGSQTIAMGLSATSISANAIAIGTFAQGSNSSVVSIGTNANNTTGSVGANAIAIGNNSNSGIVNVGASSVAIGDTATAQNTWDVAIGFNVTVNGVGGGSDSNVGIGSFVTSTGASAVAVGPFTSATGNNGIAIGKGAYANVSEQISIGRDAGLMTLGTVGTSTISIGQSTNFGSNGENYNIGSSSVAIGQQAFTSGDQSIAIGFNAGALTSGLPITEI